MATVIANGTVVNAADTFRADVRIENGKVTAVGNDVARPGDERVDAAGRYVMPGGIDAHTHLDMPFMGTTSSDDFETGTIAAAFGGTTTVVDFIIPEKGKSLQAAHAAWRAKAEGKAVVDYAFHCCLVEMAPGTLAEMDALVRDGITSFKVFTAYPGALMIDDGAIYAALRWAAKSGALIQVHAENGPAIARIVEEMIASGRTDPVHHGLSRPSALEGEATSRVIALAEVAQAPVYIVHLTCREALSAVRDARRRGVRAFAETCPQYLYCSLDDLARPDFEGAKYVCSPPLRPKEHQDVLWRGLAVGDLQTVATDHCPFYFRGQKEMGRGDFRKIPNGMPTIESRLPLMYQGVVDGHIGLNKFVDLVSTMPAKLFGLYPRKGAVAAGSDADIVIWNPERRTDLSASHMHMRVDYSPYEGRIVQGGVERVLVRGKTIVDSGRFTGHAGDGRFQECGAFSAK